MPEIRSPLAAHLKPGTHGAVPKDGTPLTLLEHAPDKLAQIAGWEDFAEAAAPALSALGFDGLGDYRSVRASGSAECMRIAPDKLLLSVTDALVLSSALAELDSSRVTTLDLSHARWLVRINGPVAEDLLARLAPLDFSLSNFQVGTFAQTGIHHVGVLIRRISIVIFEILIPVTWAATIWELISDTAAPFGYRIEGRRS